MSSAIYYCYLLTSRQRSRNGIRHLCGQVFVELLCKWWPAYRNHSFRFLTATFTLDLVRYHYWHDKKAQQGKTAQMTSLKHCLKDCDILEALKVLDKLKDMLTDSGRFKSMKPPHWTICDAIAKQESLAKVARYRKGVVNHQAPEKSTWAAMAIH